MNWNVLVRQLHRWVSIAFVAIVIAVMAISAIQEESAEWIFFLPLFPLLLLVLTGLNLFVMPYVARRRRAGSVS